MRTLLCGTEASMYEYTHSIGGVFIRVCLLQQNIPGLSTD